MEFIGLLGLIGLFGLAARGDVGKKIGELREEFNRKLNRTEELEPRIADNEKNFGGIVREVQRINSALQNFTTTDDLEKIYRRVNDDLAELKRNPPSDPEIDAALNQLNENFKTLQNAVKNFQTTADELKSADKNLSARLKQIELPTQNPLPPDNSLKILEQRIAALEAERLTFLNKIAEQNSFLQQYQTVLAQMQTRLTAQEARVKKSEESSPDNAQIFERRIASLEAERLTFLNKIAELEARLEVSKKPPAPPTKPPTIRDFHIKKSDDKIFFTGKQSELPKRLNVVQNLSPLTNFLQNADFDKRDGFLSIVDNYKKNLERFAAKIKRNAFDEDNLSEEVTRDFFSVLSKYFIAPLMTAILRGGKENPEIYAKLLSNVNAYLNSCNVYTEFIEAGKVMRSQDVNNMRITPKKTDKRLKDKIIDEVEQLPYFMSYLTEDGDEDFFCCEGKMIVLKFDGGK